jgi:hypothetical protein
MEKRIALHQMDLKKLNQAHQKNIRKQGWKPKLWVQKSAKIMGSTECSKDYKVDQIKRR